MGVYNYHRSLFDYPDFRMKKVDSWVRLRTDGKETTLTYKKTIKEKPDDISSEDIGMKEIEVKVDSYEKTYEFLKCIGLIVKREEKNKRIRYKKDDVVFDIDFWPFIPAYLEIESDSYEKVKDAINKLGLNPKNGFICSNGAVYRKYGFNTHDYSAITFEGMTKK